MKAVVAYFSFFENELKQTLVEDLPEDANWKDAYLKAMPKLRNEAVNSDEDYRQWVEGLDEDLSIAGEELCNGEETISVVFIAD